MRIGFGYDVHRLVEGRKLILGGVEIPYEKGLLGHSDADVLVHSMIDSLYGALAMGDIGSHFPDTDLRYKDADSLVLLKVCYQEIIEKGYQIGNLDCTVIAQAPKLRPYIDQMRDRISKILEIDLDDIGIKATTEEGLGFTGRHEGISANTVCLLRKTS